MYLDDIRLRSENDEQHRKHIKAVFQKMDKYGFKLGSVKCKFSIKQVEYLGQIIDKNSRKSYPEWAEAIKNMSSPNNISNLQVFLGLASYYSIYFPKVYDPRALLNDILKKDRKWIWLKECAAVSRK